MTALTQHKKMPPLPGTFNHLIRGLPTKAIRDDNEHRDMVNRIDKLMQIVELTEGQSIYLETLVELVEAYEAKRHAINVSNLRGIRMLKYILEQSGLSRSDLARLLNIHPTMGSKILKGDRKLTWEHAKILGAKFKVEAVLFMD